MARFGSKTKTENIWFTSSLRSKKQKRNQTEQDFIFFSFLISLSIIKTLRDGFLPLFFYTSLFFLHSFHSLFIDTYKKLRYRILISSLFWNDLHCLKKVVGNTKTEYVLQPKPYHTTINLIWFGSNMGWLGFSSNM